MTPRQDARFDGEAVDREGHCAGLVARAGAGPVARMHAGLVDDTASTGQPMIDGGADRRRPAVLPGAGEQ